MINIQDYILEQLNKPGKFTTAYEGTSKVVTSIGAGVPIGASGWIDIPMTQSQFAVLCDIPGHETQQMLLKKFTWPEAGIDYSMDEEKMWFPIPTVGAKSITMEGYLFRKDINSLYYLYNRQFTNGLISMNAQPTFAIAKLIPYEEFDAKMPLAEAGAVMKGMLAGMAEQGGLDANASMAIDTEDVISDVALQAENRKYQDLSFSVTGMVELQKCKISKPVIQMAQESNEFATVAIQVAYSDIRYCPNITLEG